MTWMEMLTLILGIHGFFPLHVFPCPTALLSMGSYLRSVSILHCRNSCRWEIVPKKDPLNHLPVLYHSLLVGLIATSHTFRVKAAIAELHVHFAFISAAVRTPEASPTKAFMLAGTWRNKVEVVGNPLKNCIWSVNPDSTWKVLNLLSRQPRQRNFSLNCLETTVFGLQSTRLSLCVVWSVHITISVLSGWINPSCTQVEKKNQCCLRQMGCESSLSCLRLEL